MITFSQNRLLIPKVIHNFPPAITLTHFITLGQHKNTPFIFPIKMSGFPQLMHTGKQKTASSAVPVD